MILIFLRLVSEERYLEDRVSHVERHVAALALDLGALARKMARMRDKGDKIVSAVRDFASAESGSLRKSLEGMGECLSALENSQQLQVCIYCMLSAEHCPVLCIWLVMITFLCS